MQRNDITDTDTRGPYYQWSTDDLDQAMLSVNDGSMKLAAAAKQFNIPYNTLKRRLNGVLCNYSCIYILCLCVFFVFFYLLTTLQL